MSKSLNFSNVYIHKRCDDGAIFYYGRVLNRGKFFETERDAAKYVDLVLIDNNRPPINILKAKI